jgi:glycyl-tRNA synthetase beta chain
MHIRKIKPIFKRAVKMLSEALKTAVSKRLTKEHLENQGISTYATPRRLATRIKNLIAEQPCQHNQRRGPALQAAYDADGNLSKALSKQ